MTDEAWKPVVGLPKYLVSSLGRIQHARSKKLRAVHLDQYGYAMVSLYVTGTTKITRRVHRLVLDTFVRPARDGEMSEHLNGDRADNRLCNLRWK
jgi:hypothetical protein